MIFVFLYFIEQENIIQSRGRRKTQKKHSDIKILFEKHVFFFLIFYSDGPDATFSSRKEAR